MSYGPSASSIWIAQAHDLVGTINGQATPGWVSGQLMSATASVWEGQANDRVGTINGKPTPGWANAQRYSVTANQWQVAAWDPGGQLYSYGAGHGGNGAGGVLWRDAAQQMQQNWYQEWTNARDPQGLPYSYPGQPPNAVLWAQSAAFWRSAYDTVIPPAGVDHIGSSGDVASDSTQHTACSLTLDRGGNWIIVFGGSANGVPSGTGFVMATGLVGGVQVAAVDAAPASSPIIAVAWQGGVTAGTVVTVNIKGEGAGARRQGYIDAFFIPTSTNPH